MKIEIMQRNYVAKEKLLDLINKKLERFEKYLDKSASAKVVLSKSGSLERYKMEVTINAKNTFVRSEVETDNMYANIDICLAKLEKQIVRISGKKKDAIKNVDPMDLLFFDEIPEIMPAKIVKQKEFVLEAISEDEAIDNLENLGNSFYIYKDKFSGNVNVLYKRTDGNYGLIKTK